LGANETKAQTGRFNQKNIQELGMNDIKLAEPAQPAQERYSAASIIMQGQSFDRVFRIAELMASGVATVPQHLQKNVGDCAAVTIQALQWGMNPYAVAQKTHLINKTLGYEAQLVNAVITSMAPTKDRLNFEWFGNWDPILGNFVERESKSKKDDNGYPVKYRVPGWDISQEKGLGVRVWATLKGESSPRELKLLMTQARTRNSTLWADDPKQQLAYLAIKRWARLYCPDVILGVYTPDELEPSPEIELNPIDPITPPEPEKKPYYPDEAFNKHFDKWKTAIQSGSQTHDDWINTLSAKGTLTEDQLKRINEVKAPIQGEAEVVE
jgi:hypothetical protein